MRVSEQPEGHAGRRRRGLDDAAPQGNGGIQCCSHVLDTDEERDQ
jgi:hypothetical protein